MRQRQRQHEARPARAAQRARRSPLGGFTLIELLIVMVIIGILLAFILAAATDGIRRAEERATQALIAKIEAGLTDRVEALTLSRTDANQAHLYMSAWYNNGTAGTFQTNEQRAMVIAQFDKMKGELPDVFVIEFTDASRTQLANPSYPFNFAAAPYPGLPSGAVSANLSPYLLPLGIDIQNDPANGSYGCAPAASPNPPFPESTGIFGASYSARGGFAKQLGANPKGYDGANNNGNDDPFGQVDEIDEWGDFNHDGVISGSESGVTLAEVTAKLANHTHKTARAEALYAVLVEGVGPSGSTFDRDDFSDREVSDTDGDGLLEFVDAWGEPIQFFRWPIFYHGTGHPTFAAGDTYLPATQRGYLPYPNVLVTREQNPLDPNQLLISPDWWSPTFNNAGTGTMPLRGPADPVGPLSGTAALFSQFFIPLTDPWANPSVTVPSNGQLWDRGSDYSQRRAYYSRFLVLSGGPDKTPGVAVLSPEYFNKLDYIESEAGTSLIAGAVSGFAFPTGNADADAYLARIESQGGAVTPFRTSDPYQTPLSLTGVAAHQQMDAAIRTAGDDDITSHNLQAPGGATQ